MLPFNWATSDVFLPARVKVANMDRYDRHVKYKKVGPDCIRHLCALLWPIADDEGSTTRYYGRAFIASGRETSPRKSLATLQGG